MGADPWSRVRPGDPNGFRTAQHLSALAARNRAERGQAGAIAGVIDNCGPPFWDRPSWDRFREQTGREPFSQSEMPLSMEGAPAWVYERMGMRPPLMAR